MKKNIYLLYLIIFLQGLVFYGPIATLFRESRGLSMSEILITSAVVVVTIFIFEIPFGLIADRIGYKKTLMIANLVFLISKCAFYLAYGFRGFLLEAVLIGIAIAGISGCDSALIYKSCSEEESAKIFSHYSAFGIIGLLVGSILSSFMVKVSLDFTALMTIIPYALALIATLFLSDVEYEHREVVPVKSSLKNILSNKRMLIFAISAGLFMETTHSICVFLNQPIYIKTGIDIRYFGIILALLQLVSLVSAKAYKFSNKYGNRKLLLSLLGITAIAMIIFAFTGSAVVVICIMIVIEVSFAIFSPICEDIKNKSINTNDRATILSSYSMITNIISFVVNLVVSFSARISNEASIIVCGMLTILSLVIMIYHFKGAREA